MITMPDEFSLYLFLMMISLNLITGMLYINRAEISEKNSKIARCV